MTCPSDVNAVLLPRFYPTRVGFRLEPHFAFALIVDRQENYPNGRPLMQVWVSQWDGGANSPADVIWVGRSWRDARDWIVKRFRGTSACVIDRVPRRGEAAHG